jgi:hypothetical protein
MLATEYLAFAMVRYLWKGERHDASLNGEELHLLELWDP